MKSQIFNSPTLDTIKKVYQENFVCGSSMGYFREKDLIRFFYKTNRMVLLEGTATGWEHDNIRQAAENAILSIRTLGLNTDFLSQAKVVLTQILTREDAFEFYLLEDDVKAVDYIESYISHDAVSWCDSMGILDDTYPPSTTCCVRIIMTDSGNEEAVLD